MQKSILCLVLAMLFACQQPSKKLVPAERDHQVLLSQSEHTPAFDRSFQELMEAYFKLKDGFIQEDTAAITLSGKILKVAADSLKLNELKADSNLISTAFTYTEGIASEVMGLLGENSLHAKRLSFQMISDQVYDLIRTVQYNQQMMYHFYCARAFDDQGAYWINALPESKNPYNPTRDAACAVVRDTIHFPGGN